MKRLFFLNRFFLPDHSATSQLLGDLTSYLARRGCDVHVVTSRQRYDDPQANLPARETIAGVHVHRVATTRYSRIYEMLLAAGEANSGPAIQSAR